MVVLTYGVESHEADIYLQKAVKAWSNQPNSAQVYAQTAREIADEAPRLVNAAILKTVTLIVVIPTITVAVLVVRRRRNRVATVATSIELARC